MSGLIEGVDPARAHDEPDPHGQAALLLAESMLHVLIERSVIRTEDAVEMVAIAAEVKVEVAELTVESPQISEKSLRLLTAIGHSLQHDVDQSSASDLQG